MAGSRKQGTQIDKPKPLVKIKSGSIIALFNKTGPPKKPSDVHCPHFWELKYANGCKFDCQWCFLNGTFRFQPHGKAPRLKKERTIEKDTMEGLIKITDRSMFNAGEVSDGLLFPSVMQRVIIPLFREERTNPHDHKLLLLTKDTDTRTIAYASATKNVVFAWSVNAKVVADEYELYAPSVANRLRAARYAIENGYEVRLRIDPMVPITRWDKHYKRLVEDIMKQVPWVSVITLGSLRGLNSTITACKKNHKDISWTDYLKDKTNWGLRVPVETRIEMYQFVIDLLEELGYQGDIALCKESIEVWEQLEMDPKKTKCNCIL